MRVVFKEPLVLFIQKVRVQEKEGRIGAVLFPGRARRMPSTAKLDGSDRGGMKRSRRSTRTRKSVELMGEVQAGIFWLILLSQ